MIREILENLNEENPFAGSKFDEILYKILYKNFTAESKSPSFDEFWEVVHLSQTKFKEKDVLNWYNFVTKKGKK